MPVVTIDPATVDIDQLLLDQVEQIVFNITNHGLVTALDISLSLPVSEKVEFRPQGFINPVGDVPGRTSLSVVVDVVLLISPTCGDLPPTDPNYCPYGPISSCVNVTCDEGATCVNSSTEAGGYVCVSCPTGMEMSGADCVERDSAPNPCFPWMGSFVGLVLLE